MSIVENVENRTQAVEHIRRALKGVAGLRQVVIPCKLAKLVGLETPAGKPDDGLVRYFGGDVLKAAGLTPGQPIDENFFENEQARLLRGTRTKSQGICPLQWAKDPATAGIARTGATSLPGAAAYG